MKSSTAESRGIKEGNDALDYSPNDDSDAFTVFV